MRHSVLIIPAKSGGVALPVRIKMSNVQPVFKTLSVTALRIFIVLNTGCPKKFARIRGTVHCCFVVKFDFSWVSDKTGNKWSKDILFKSTIGRLMFNEQ